MPRQSYTNFSFSYHILDTETGNYVGRHDRPTPQGFYFSTLTSAKTFILTLTGCLPLDYLPKVYRVSAKDEYIRTHRILKLPASWRIVERDRGKEAVVDINLDKMIGDAQKINELIARNEPYGKPLRGLCNKLIKYDRLEEFKDVLLVYKKIPKDASVKTIRRDHSDSDITQIEKAITILKETDIKRSDMMRHTVGSQTAIAFRSPESMVLFRLAYDSSFDTTYIDLRKEFSDDRNEGCS